jgi:hypothetical protein
MELGPAERLAGFAFDFIRRIDEMMVYGSIENARSAVQAAERKRELRAALPSADEIVIHGAPFADEVRPPTVVLDVEHKAEV